MFKDDNKFKFNFCYFNNNNVRKFNRFHNLYKFKNNFFNFNNNFHHKYDHNNSKNNNTNVKQTPFWKYKNFYIYNSNLYNLNNIDILNNNLSISKNNYNYNSNLYNLDNILFISKTNYSSNLYNCHGSLYIFDNIDNLCDFDTFNNNYYTFNNHLFVFDNKLYTFHSCNIYSAICFASSHRTQLCKFRSSIFDCPHNRQADIDSRNVNYCY